MGRALAPVFIAQRNRSLSSAACCCAYRFDNNILPASPQFLWRETGPIDFYADNGYAYIHMDVREADARPAASAFDRKDQEDLYDIIEWIGRQPGATAG
jgi:predicted acyl esterase